MTPYERAKRVFEGYAAEKDSTILQARVARWQSYNFGACDPLVNALGVNEEIAEGFGAFARLAVAAGKMSHLVLKGHQRIRGYADEERLRAAIADSVADQQIFAMGVATLYRFDLDAIVAATAEEVMQRDWKRFPKDGLTE